MPRNHHKLDITQRISLLVRSSWLLFIHTANILVARPYKQRNSLSDVEFAVVSWNERLLFIHGSNELLRALINSL